MWNIYLSAGLLVLAFTWTPCQGEGYTYDVPPDDKKFDEKFVNTLPDQTEGASSNGVPGKDYPTYDKVPATKFTCANKIPGYYADTETRCQVFHVCTQNLVSVFRSYLCPNESIFNQEIQKCDWWQNVDCESSEKFYYKNKDVRISSSLSSFLQQIKKILEMPRNRPVKKENADTIPGIDVILKRKPDSNENEISEPIKLPYTTYQPPIISIVSTTKKFNPSTETYTTTTHGPTTKPYSTTTTTRPTTKTYRTYSTTTKPVTYSPQTSTSKPFVSEVTEAAIADVFKNYEISNYNGNITVTNQSPHTAPKSNNNGTQQHVSLAHILVPEPGLKTTFVISGHIQKDYIDPQYQQAVNIEVSQTGGSGTQGVVLQPNHVNVDSVPVTDTTGEQKQQVDLSQKHPPQMYSPVTNTRKVPIVPEHSHKFITQGSQYSSGAKNSFIVTGSSPYTKTNNRAPFESPKLEAKEYTSIITNPRKIPSLSGLHSNHFNSMSNEAIYVSKAPNMGTPAFSTQTVCSNPQTCRKNSEAMIAFTPTPTITSMPKPTENAPVTTTTERPNLTDKPAVQILPNINIQTGTSTATNGIVQQQPTVNTKQNKLIPLFVKQNTLNTNFAGSTTAFPNNQNPNFNQKTGFGFPFGLETQFNLFPTVSYDLTSTAKPTTTSDQQFGLFDQVNIAQQNANDAFIKAINSQFSASEINKYQLFPQPTVQTIQAANLDTINNFNGGLKSQQTNVPQNIGFDGQNIQIQGGQNVQEFLNSFTDQNIQIGGGQNVQGLLGNGQNIQFEGGQNTQGLLGNGQDIQFYGNQNIQSFLRNGQNIQFDGNQNIPGVFFNNPDFGSQSVQTVNRANSGTISSGKTSVNVIPSVGFYLNSPEERQQFFSSFGGSQKIGNGQSFISSTIDPGFQFSQEISYSGPNSYSVPQGSISQLK